MEFIVTDRQGIEEGVVVRSAYIVISIHDSYELPAKVVRQSGLSGVLQLAFDDIEPDPPDENGITGGLVLMTRQHARQIWDFVEQHRNEVDTIVVHCEAGFCRSPAVAAALCRGMGGDDARFFWEYQPNQHVYRLMMDVAPGRHRHEGRIPRGTKEGRQHRGDLL